MRFFLSLVISVVAVGCMLFWRFVYAVNRCKQINASTTPVLQCPSADSRCFRQVFQRKKLPIVRNFPNRRSVVALFKTVCPSTVARFVVSGSVWPSIQGGSRRFFSHIRNKFFKVIPSFAYLNALPAVARVGFAFGIIATFSHGLPSGIQGVESLAGSVRSSCKAVSQISGKKLFSRQASTTLCVTA